MCVWRSADGVGGESWKSHEMLQRCEATLGTLQRLCVIFLDCLTFTPFFPPRLRREEKAERAAGVELVLW